MLSTSLFAGVITPDVAERITVVEAADQFPIYAMIVAAGQVRETTNTRPQWGQTNLGALRTQINNAGTAYGAGETELVVDNSSIYRVADTIVSEATGEVMLIVANNTGTNTLTLRRGVGSIAGSTQSVANDVWLQLVANASGEGAPLRASTETQITMLDNYTQIFRERATVTKTMDATQTSTEQERPRQRRDAYLRQLHSIERAMVHGQKSQDKTDAENRISRTMGGLRAAITTHVTSGIGNMTEDAFEAAVAGSYSFGSRSKVGFGGPTSINAINKIFRGRSRTSAPDAPVGMQVTRILHGLGELTLVPHMGMTGAFANDMLIVDMAELELRPLSGRSLRLNENVQANGDDAVSDEWLAEHTMTWGSEKAHAQLRGITGGVVSNP